VKRLAQYLVKYYQSVLENVSDSTSGPYKVGIFTWWCNLLFDHVYVFKKFFATTNETVE